MTAPRIRPYRPGDETSILDLYRVVFKLDMTLDEWRWYYRGGPTGRGPVAVIVVAESEGRIIGHYAVQPRPFCLDGRRVTAGLVMGSMVAPEFRNITTFIEMAKAAYALCREQQIGFLYAFPNDNVWLVRQRMLDWQALPRLHALCAAPADIRVPEVAVPDVVASGAAVPNGAVSGVAAPETAVPEVERLRPGEPFLAADWLEACPDQGIRAVCSPDWLTWRLLERPGVEYYLYTARSGDHLQGYIALKRYQVADGRVDGHIVAFRVRPGEEHTTGALLLARARRHFEETGAGRVTLWLLPRSPLHSLIVRAGMTPEQPGKNFGYLSLDDTLNPALAPPDRWDVTMSDSDVF